jgi:hypothetical protein
MSPVPQGTAELIAHIFQPSLPGLFSFWSNAPRTDVLGYFHAAPSGLGGRIGYVNAGQERCRAIISPELARQVDLTDSGDDIQFTVSNYIVSARKPRSSGLQ